VVLTDANEVDKNFGNRGALSISGTKFFDLDGDGSKGPGESGLPDWKIYCDSNDDGVFQDGETYAITDANGAYTLAYLGPGTYKVREVLKTGWTQTTPAANLHTVVLADANIADKNFGNRGSLSISGTKFSDLNGMASRTQERAASLTGRSTATATMTVSSRMARPMQSQMQTEPTHWPTSSLEPIKYGRF
jgi:hypothetical protein